MLLKHMNDDLQTALAFLVIILMILGFFILFEGDPDIYDLLIQRIKEGLSK